MKKVLILANNSVGLYNFRMELIERLIKDGYEVYFSLPESIEDEKVKLLVNSGANHIQTNINRRGINPLEDVKLIKDYKKIMKEVNPDLVLTYTIKPNIYGAYAASKFQKPIVMNITGIGTSLAQSKLRHLVSSLYKYACRKAEYVFFQNQSNYSLFLDKKMVDSSRSILVPGSGVNTSKFKPRDVIKKDSIIKFLLIGRVMKEKGIEEYISAANDLANKYGNVEFQVLGPFEEEKYRASVENSNNIKYLGTSTDVRNEIENIDCIVNPSHHEGMSNVLLEGASMGKPLIASNIPGCREIIKDGFNGFLFEVKSSESLKEKIIRFIELKSEEKRLLGTNSRIKIEDEFDRNIVIEKYTHAINNILDKGR